MEMGIAIGSYQDADGIWQLHNGSGGRSAVYDIKFTDQYQSPPAVFITMSGHDSDAVPNARIVVWAKNVTTTGFQAEFYTWENSIINTVWAPWLAVEGASVAPTKPRVAVTGLDCRNELVTITNQGPTPVDLSGWTIHDQASANTFSFPAGTTLAPGASVSIRSGRTPAQPGEIFWKTNDVWNNAGDTATLVDLSGTEVSNMSC